MGGCQGSTRRRIARVIVAVAGLAALGGAVRAQRKLSKSEAQYQDHPQDIQMCSACTLFVRPRACKMVEGDISPDGWCRLFDMAD